MTRRRLTEPSHDRRAMLPSLRRCNRLTLRLASASASAAALASASASAAALASSSAAALASASAARRASSFLRAFSALRASSRSAWNLIHRLNVSGFLMEVVVVVAQCFGAIISRLTSSQLARAPLPPPPWDVRKPSADLQLSPGQHQL